MRAAEESKQLPANWAVSSDVEAEARIGRESPTVHASQDGHTAVNVVVDLHARLALDGAQDPADVLDESTLERDREREEQRVEGRAVEPFTQEAAGRDHDHAAPGLKPCEGPRHEATCLLLGLPRFGGQFR